ncbi:MAG: hypothetical protein KDA60_09625 [Planctomycetales bacterium]|nr:hypothetical protein [Planctomycetales bacterium]
MPRRIALEWDDHEIRLAGAVTRGRDFELTHLASIPLASSGDTSDKAAAHDLPAIGTRIHDALREHGFAKSEAVVALGRAGIELRLISVPPAPADELPNLVRFQAFQQFAVMGDDWALDYVTTETEAGMTRQVLAAALPPASLKDIEIVCEAAQLKIVGVVLRPSGTASLLRHQIELQPGPVVLVIDILNDSADLTILNHDAILLTRTIRVPIYDDSKADTWLSVLKSEVRRTLAAARTQLRGSTIDEIIVYGEDVASQQLETELQSSQHTPVRLLRPLDKIRCDANLERRAPSHTERFAPLVGILRDELAQRPHAIDFWRPKRPAEPPSRRTTWSLAGIAAACAILALIGWVVWKTTSLDAEIRRLGRESQQLNKDVEVARQQGLRLASIENWYQQAPVWLNELRHLAEKLPPPEQLRVSSLQADMASGGGGAIVLKGFVNDAVTVAQLEDKLRDPRRSVVGLDRDFVGTDREYPWYFMERVVVSTETSPDQAEVSQAPPPADSSAEEAAEKQEERNPIPSDQGRTQAPDDDNASPDRPSPEGGDR